MKKKPFFCVVENEIQAESVAIELALEGFTHYDVSVLLPENRGESDKWSTSGAYSCMSSETGASLGALGLLALSGNLPVPGLGTLLAKGPLMIALRGDFDLVEALKSLGIPEEMSHDYAEKVSHGGILMGVFVRNGSPEEKIISHIFSDSRVQSVFPLKEAVV